MKESHGKAAERVVAPLDRGRESAHAHTPSMSEARTGSTAKETARSYIERHATERATFRSDDAASTARSFANMEDDLQREYFGRFLIELIQNARDAWMGGAAERGGGVVRITLTKDPALVVCNEGDPIRPEVVIDSLGKYGESSKPFGSGIGYKGIGFKSILEISLTPELFSRRDSSGPWDIAVRFDPDEARAQLDTHTPGWREMLAGLPGSAGRPDGADRVPVLYFPIWVPDPEASLRGLDRLDGHSFNTVVRLPHSGRFDERLGLSRDEFVGRIRAAMADITDEIVLLLGAFEEVILEDELEGTQEIIRRTVESYRQLLDGGRLATVSIARNGLTTSRWWLFEDKVNDLGDEAAQLEQSIAVAVRQEAEDLPGATSVLRPGIGACAQAFHLFFPTQIATHLPFLFHAYFEVDVSRTVFARAKSARNEKLLDGLLDLTRRAVRYLAAEARSGRVDLRSFPKLFASDGKDPDDELAREFRTGLLASLDREAWVSVQTSDSRPAFAAPADLLVDAVVQNMLPAALPAAYVSRRIDRYYPDPAIEPAALAFLAERNRISRGAEREGLGPETLFELLTPGAISPWDGSPDDGFRALLLLLDRLRGLRPTETDQVLQRLVGNAAAAFIPVVTDDPSMRRLRPPASGGRRDRTDGTAGAIMARIRARSDAELAPPRALEIDFLPDRVIDQNVLTSIGQSLGIRPQTTIAILDAIAGGAWIQSDAEAILRFTWRLLLRERESAFSVVETRATAATFDPGQWYWARRGRGRSDNELADQRREHGLARLRVPTRSGAWRPVGELVFGSDWADWIETFRMGGSVAQMRAEAYRDLDDLGRPDSDFIAGPDALAAILPLDPLDLNQPDDSEPPPEGSLGDEHLGLLHAFLLRLGAWEVPPLDEINDYSDRPSTSLDAWVDLPERPRHRDTLRDAPIDFNHYHHHRIHVAEDYRLRWPLTDSPAFVRSLSRAIGLYEKCDYAVLFCPGCQHHGTRYWNSEPSRQPSLLAHTLHTQPWVPVSIGGRQASPARPTDAWFDPEPPDPSRIAQSPRRFLALASTDVTTSLAEFTGIARVDTASADRISHQLDALRDSFMAGDVVSDRRAGSIEGQAFAGLHRELYERLHSLASRAGEERRHEITSLQAVLATVAQRLEFREVAECRHDNGRFAALKGHFLSTVPFVVLNRDQTAVAGTLGIPRFELEIARRPGGTETDVTERLRPMIHDRAAEFLAVQAFHPLGSQALELGSEAFRERAERLAALKVVQLDNLVLDVRVEGTEINIAIGSERDQDMFLEAATTSQPVLYHDLSGDGWEQRFRQRVGTHLAVMLENSAYAATFRLLLQQDSRSDREAFLADIGIFDEQLDQVAAQLRTGSVERRAEDRRWWNALLPMLGASEDPINDAELPSAVARSVFEDLGLLSGPDSLGEMLLQAGGGSEVRRDVGPRAPLALLEAAGIDLRALDSRLSSAAGGDGLRIEVAQGRLSAWRALHGREVATVLALAGVEPETARAKPSLWRAPERLRFHVAVAPVDYLAPVVADLAEAGLEVDASDLDGPHASEVLAALVKERPEAVVLHADQLYSEEERRRLAREHAVAYRNAVKRVIVATRTDPGDLSSRIRAEAEIVDRELGPSVDAPPELTDGVRLGLAMRPDLGEALAAILDAWRPTLGPPSTGGIYAAARDLIEPASHLDHVISVLARERRHLAESVRADITKVHDLGLRPCIPEGGTIPPRPQPPKHGGARLIGPRRSHDQHKRDQLGLQGEELVRATVLEALLALPPAEFSGAVEFMIELLRSVGKGEVVESLVRRGREAIAESADDDARLEALARFVHVALESDGFGFDILGWVELALGDQRPMLLEVKSSPICGFLASTGEWSCAEEQGARYAFVCVHRRDPGPPDMDLLLDPAQLFAQERLRREGDTWAVRY